MCWCAVKKLLTHSLNHWTFWVSLHTLPGELTSRHYCTCTGHWFDPSWTMGVLYMALLEALTYECWILVKTTHFGCALAFRTSPSSSLCILANELPLRLPGCRWDRYNSCFCLSVSLPVFTWFYDFMTTGTQNLSLNIFPYLSKLNAVKTILLFCYMNLICAQTYAYAKWSKIGMVSLLETQFAALLRVI